MAPAGRGRGAVQEGGVLSDGSPPCSCDCLIWLFQNESGLAGALVLDISSWVGGVTDRFLPVM